MGCCGTSKNEKQQKKDINLNLTPIEQLKIRLASGEISIDEYMKIKSVLEQ